MERLFEGQGRHALLLGVLLALLYAATRLGGSLEGSALGLGTPTWIVIAAAVPIAHQGYVWLAWRLELHHRLATRVLGRAALTVHVVVFMALFGSRPIAIYCLAVANTGTLPGSADVWRIVALVLVPPAAYLFFCVRRDFGFARPTGADHFDPRWREPLVRRGIFRWTPNAMYVFGFLPLWSLALWFGSAAATAVAAFSHAYIWVHYICTERPNMRRIYGAGTQVDDSGTGTGTGEQ